MSINSAPSSVQGALQFPIFAGTLSALLCATGVWIFISGRNSERLVRRVGTRGTPTKQSRLHLSTREIIYCIMVASTVTVFVLYWSNSIFITLPFTFFTLMITWTYFRNRFSRVADQLLEVWPEVTDHLISGLHSGMSLSEALTGLATRGPLLVRPHFLSFHQELLRTGDFSQAIEDLRARFSSHGSDQIFEAILLAKSLGGSELLQIFRTLGDFLRQDLAVRKEIEIKHGWIKNSAHLSAAAPWLLLLLLSSQPATARAFNQPSGVAILLLGLLLTGFAYFWMGRLGRMPKSPRVFRGTFR
ncbi:MAG: type II secretion system F family protein [Actinobacteria bacterium]|nr:type II secretion system F family protein [Actinomycetota bacterium]